MNEFGVSIASCSLPYLESPYQYLEKLMYISRYLVLDRMPIISDLDQDVVKLQNTTTKDGLRVSYPAWFFSENKLKEQISNFGGRIVATWSVPEDRPIFKLKRRPYVGYLIEIEQ